MFRPKLALSRAILIVSCVVVGLTLAANPAHAQPQAQGSVGACPVFPANNWWNRDVSADPVDPNSANFINTIGATKKLHPDYGSNPTYGIPYILVTSAQPKVPITFDAYASDSDPGPYPIPANLPIESGSDAHALIVDTSSCLLYELYHANYNAATGWHADSGAIWDLRSNRLRPEGWTSADAAGLPILPGLVRYDEVQAGAINHAIRMTVNLSQRKFIHPATHYAASSTDPNRPPMGLRLRMKASYNINGITGGARVVANAMKKYGMIVADNGSDWFFSGSNDTRWNDSDMDQLKTIPGSAFEVVKSVSPDDPENLGAYKNGIFYLKNSTTGGGADITVLYGGAASHRPLVGDWNGDGIDTIGIYDNATGVAQLRDNNSPGTPDYVLVFGNPGDAAFSGRWQASATQDGVGVYRNSNGILYLKNTLVTGFSDYFMIFGNPGDSGFAGDWQGDGVDSVGIYRPSQTRVYLTNVNGAGVTFSDLDFGFNFGTNLPVVGDWEGDGFSKVSYYNPTSGNFTLLRTLHSASTTRSVAFGPTGSYPIAGRWIAPSAPPPVLNTPPILVVPGSAGYQSGGIGGAE